MSSNEKSPSLICQKQTITELSFGMIVLKDLQDGELWQMDIVLGTSNWDICFDANLKLHEVLNQKNMNHWLDVRHEMLHDWPLWREMFPHYLSRIKF